MILVRHRNGEVFVRTAPAIEAPWPLDTVERLADRWMERGGTWLGDGLKLFFAAQEARAWLSQHPAIDFESEDHEAL